MNARALAHADVQQRTTRIRDVIDISKVVLLHMPSDRIGDIQRAVCAHYGLTLIDMRSHRRSRNVAWPRQVAMFLAREMTVLSLPAIGRRFGGRDHSTLLHACKRVTQRLVDGDTLLAADLATLRDRLA